MTEEGDILAGVMMLPGSIGGKLVMLLITLLEGAESIVIGVGETFPFFAHFEMWPTESLCHLLCVNEGSEDSDFTP